ncbi:MAG TPA: TolC family protein, partial [Syntrophorhabdaceae bacterium]|nr:TolC family protein [Syntrophorhabdaceae bacterium]
MRTIPRETIISLLLFLCTLTGICVAAGTVQGAQYTLDDLYRLALERSDRIKISEEDVNIAETNRQKAMSLLFPRISAAGTYTGYTDRKKSDTGSQTQPFENATWSIRLDQTLSTSGRELTALKIAKELIDKNRFDLVSVKETYILNVTAGYFDVLRAAGLVDIGRQNINRLRKYRDAATTRLRIGEVTKTAVLRSEAELSAAESDLIRAEGLLGSSKAVLQRLVGIEGEFSLFDMYANTYSSMPDKDALTMEPVLLNCGSSYVECLRDTALKERSELKSLTIQKDITSRQVTYVKGANWPSISLEAAYVGKKETPQSANLLHDTTYG